MSFFDTLKRQVAQTAKETVQKTAPTANNETYTVTLSQLPVNLANAGHFFVSKGKMLAVFQFSVQLFLGKPGLGPLDDFCAVTHAYTSCNILAMAACSSASSWRFFAAPLAALRSPDCTCRAVFSPSSCQLVKILSM